MGRFYKPAQAQQLNFMKELPVDLMMKGIQQTDAANDQIYQETDLLGNAVAKVNHLATDADRVKAIQQGYNDQIQSTTQALLADPTDYRKQMPLVRNLTRDISTNMNTGELASIQSNASKLTEWDKIYKPLVGAKEGGITPEAYNTMKRSFLKNFQGTQYDAKTGAYNQLETEDVYRTQDFNKIIRDNLVKIKADAKDFKNTSDGGSWLVENNGKHEWVDAKRVARMATDSLMGDQNVMGYLKQGGKYGYLKGVSDENGNFINPYTIDAKGNPVFNEKSILTGPIRAAVGREAFDKSSIGNDMTANPYAMAANNFKLDIAKMQASDAIHDDNFDRESKIKAQYDKQGVQLRTLMQGRLLNKKAELVSAAAAAKANPGKAKVATPAKPLAVSTAKPTSPEPQLVSSPDGEVAYSPFGGAKALSFDGVQKHFFDARDNTAKLLQLSKDPSLTTNQRAMYIQRAEESRALTEQSGELLSRANQVANAKLKEKGYSDTEIKILNDKYASTIAGLESQVRAADQATNIDPAALRSGNVPDSYTQAVARRNQLMGAMNRMKQGHKDLVGEVDGYLKTNSDMTQTKLVGAGLNPSQKKILQDTFKADPSAFVLRNPDNDEQENLGLNTDEFKKFHAEGGTINFHRVNAPAPGLGVTVAVDFTDKNGKASAKDKIMTIPYNVANALGQSLTKENSKLHKDIGNTISDEFKVNFLSSIKNKVNDVVSGKDSQPAGFFNYYDPGTRSQTTIKVVPASDKANSAGTADSYKAFFRTDKGYVPLNISKDKSNEFPNEQAIADAFADFTRNQAPK